VERLRLHLQPESPPGTETERSPERSVVEGVSDPENRSITW